MSKPHIPYFDFYPADFMNGVRGLTAQDVGVYTMILCRIYEESAPVEFHTLRLATYCGMREATFKKTIEKLIDLDKFQVVDGCISNRRAETEISNRSHKLKIASRAGKASAEKRQQKQQPVPTGVQQAFNHTDTDTDTDKDADDSAGASEGNLEPREHLLKAMGLPPDGLTPSGRIHGNSADMFEAKRWADDLGLSVPEQVAVIRDVMQRSSSPPSTFKYFTGAMQEAAGRKASPPLKASIPTETVAQFPRIKVS